MCGWVEGGPISNTSINAQGAAEAKLVRNLAGSSGGNAGAEVALLSAAAVAATEVAQPVVAAEVRWVDDR